MAKVADIDLELFESGQGSPALFLHGGEGFDQGSLSSPRSPPSAV